MDRHITDTFLHIFLQYKRGYVQLKMQLNKARNTYIVFGMICKFIEYICDILCRIFIRMTHVYVEPDEPAWICTCKYFPSVSIADDPSIGFNVGMKDVPIIGNYNPLGVYNSDGYARFYKMRPEIVNEYTRFTRLYLNYWYDTTSQTDVDCRENVYWNEYKSEYKNACKSLLDCDWLSDSLIMAKVSPNAVRVRIAKNINIKEDMNDFNPCRFKFTEVEYRCGPDTVVPIEIPKSHYIVDNEILSKSYILRYLEHKFPIYSKYDFDEHSYSVCIMDSDFNTFSIKGNQYIQLNEDGYEIKIE